MAEFAASLVTLSEVGFRIEDALRDLIETIQSAEDDVTHMALIVQSNTVLAQALGEKVERYSQSQTAHVQNIHSVLGGLIEHCNSIYCKIETVLDKFNASTNVFQSGPTNLS